MASSTRWNARRAELAVDDCYNLVTTKSLLLVVVFHVSAAGLLVLVVNLICEIWGAGELSNVTSSFGPEPPARKTGCVPAPPAAILLTNFLFGLFA
jgi:hypothetical protein